MTDKPLPPDIDPDSRSRLPYPRREDLDGDAKAIFDKMSDPAGGSLAGMRGPGGIRLHSPKTGVLTRALNDHLRHGAGIDARVRELAILVTAREFDSQFEWAAHEPQALKDGLSREIIDVVKHRKGVDGLAEADAVIIELGRQAFGRHRVAPEVFARAQEIFGPAGLVDLVSLMGMYSATAVLLATFDAQLPPGQEPLLPVG